MGGMVVQKYAARHALPGMALMASVPPGGLLSTFGGLAIARPLHLASLTLLQALGPRAVSKADMRRIFFSDDIADSLLGQYCARMQPESQRAVLNLVAVRLSACRLHDTPVLVVGGERDALIPSRAFRDTARHYGVQARIIPGVAHAMMLETGWRAVADRLLRWLKEEAAPCLL
jgi:non-heme chloroperoxidase